MMSALASRFALRLADRFNGILPIVISRARETSAPADTVV